MEPKYFCHFTQSLSQARAAECSNRDIHTHEWKYIPPYIWCICRYIMDGIPSAERYRYREDSRSATRTSGHKCACPFPQWNFNDTPKRKSSSKALSSKLKSFAPNPGPIRKGSLARSLARHSMTVCMVMMPIPFDRPPSTNLDVRCRGFASLRLTSVHYIKGHSQLVPFRIRIVEKSWGGGGINWRFWSC